MIAAWIVYCALWTLWLSAVAWVTERLILTARGPIRMVWLSAMILSVVGPIVGYSWPRGTVMAPPARVHVTQRAIGREEIVMRAPVSPPPAAPMVTLRDVAARADRSLSMVWIATSLVFLIYVVGGVLRLRIVRRRWRTGVVDGTPVMISDNTGPALVGVFGTAIVIPAWALELEPNALALMLRHEREHRAAGDTRTLALAQALLALMPWNPLMWWHLRRLRLAIEIDCDARVLRHTSDVATYGRLLLEFGQPRRATSGAGAALADHHASQLEARIRRMTRRAPTRRARVIVSSLVAGAVAMAIGCQLPTPPAPAPLSNTTSANNVTPLFARLDSSLTPSDSAGRAASRALRARFDAKAREAEIERERQRRPAETERALDSRVAQSRDPLMRTFLDAQVVLNNARDSTSRQALLRLIDTLQRAVDSISTKSVLQTMARADSLVRELARLRMTFTDNHPMVKRVLAELQEKSVPDSVLALNGPGCGVDIKQPGTPTIKFIVSENDLSRLDRIDFTVAGPTFPGTMVETGSMSCRTEVQDQIRYSGYGAYSIPITIRTHEETSLIVVTGSGRVLAGPMTIKSEGRYVLPLRR